MKKLVFITLYVLCFYCRVNLSQRLNEVPIDLIPVDQQTYDFDPESRCLLFAHDSVVLETKDYHILVIDGGFGAFKTQFDGETVSVADLNPFTVAFDLSKNFLAGSALTPLWQPKKESDSAEKRSIVNHGGIWVSRDQKTIWTQGGHFYRTSKWVNSSYSIPKSEIPEWELWQMDVTNYEAGWKNITTDVAGYQDANRTFAGAAASVPGNSKKFWIGGLFDSTTSPTTPSDTMQTTTQMLVFDEDVSSITKQEYYANSSTDGYWQGTLIHLPIGGGYLISLMALKESINKPWIDPDGESGNQELGTPVELENIPMYDVERGVWFEQPTSWYKSLIPEPRTRFCAALFHDKSTNTFDLWMHGGQRISNQGEGISDIYVLSMPSFIWTTVETAISNANLIRSHTCHAVGSQLIIVGGYPAGMEVESNMTCDPAYIKVLDIGEEGTAWADGFQADSEYRTPPKVRTVIGDRRTPDSGFAYEHLLQDFPPIPTPTQNSTAAQTSTTTEGVLSPGAIAGASVGGVVGALAIGLGVWFYYRKRKRNRAALEANNYPPSPRYGQPEIVERGEIAERGKIVERVNNVELDGSPPSRHRPEDS